MGNELVGSLLSWIETNLLTVKFITENGLEIEGVGKFMVLIKKDGFVFNEDFKLIISRMEDSCSGDYDYFLFEFGKRWYYASVPDYYNNSGSVPLNVFKFLGRADISISCDSFYHLGVRGKYEVLNGSRDYKDWAAKAGFLGMPGIGICEDGTLAGVFSFQEACKDVGLKYVIGETISVKGEGGIYKVKVFCTSVNGWYNLLMINKAINIDNSGYIGERDFFNNSAGLVCVVSVETILNYTFIQILKTHFDYLYYQVDTVQYASDDNDKRILSKLDTYFQEYIDIIPPVLINDSYYLDQGDCYIKDTLNKIAGVRNIDYSRDQYFKTLDNCFDGFSPLFKNSKHDFLEVFQRMVSNTGEIASVCDFEIESGKLHLPGYNHSFDKSNTDLFFDLLSEGLDQKVYGKVKDVSIYHERLGKEVEVISRGGFIDYFLITADYVKYARDNDIIVGVGRGSVAGSLVAYLLDIVRVDPIKYGLLFERFLNESRITSGFPDIDIDFQSEKRKMIEDYIVGKYGRDHVANIGTYGNLKIKSAIKDLVKVYGFNDASANYVTAAMKKIAEDDTWESIFNYATESPTVKAYIQKHFKVINDMPLCLGQPRNTSIHAAGLVITPKDDFFGSVKEIYNWMPVKKSGDRLVTEWEVETLDSMGFLKCDLLGLKTLDLVSMILGLIKGNTGGHIDIDNINLKDQKVYDFFKRGLNEDVFQFGTPGLKAYCVDFQPENILDLAVINSIHRPGSMRSGLHNKYIKIRNGISEVVYDFGLEEVTKDTNGQYVYQEQIIRAVQILGNFSLSEADDVRKAMGKKKPKLMESYKGQFIKGAVDNGCDEYEAMQIWDKIEAFAGYSFNKAHAVSYSIIGYQCQWLKVYYPVEFWTASLYYAARHQKHAEKIPSRVSEIKRMNIIDVVPPDINKSQITFTPDYKNNKIYWSLLPVKNVGDIAINTVIKEREENGEYYSLSEFCKRVKESKFNPVINKEGTDKITRRVVVNKRVILNFILCGAFDEICEIKRERDRLGIIKEFYGLLKGKQNKFPEDDYSEDWIHRDEYWILKARQLIDYCYIDYEAILKRSDMLSLNKNIYVGPVEFFGDTVRGDHVVILGVLMNFIERRSKRGVFAQLELDCNSEVIYVTMWNESYNVFKKMVKGAVGKICAVSGKVGFDNWKKVNVLYSTDNTKFLLI